jgi:hypothetical protein
VKEIDRHTGDGCNKWTGKTPDNTHVQLNKVTDDRDGQTYR